MEASKKHLRDTSDTSLHKLVQDSVYPEMYRIKWSDGELSDMVNKTRAKDAIRRYEEYSVRHPEIVPANAPESPVQRFKLKDGRYPA